MCGHVTRYSIVAWRLPGMTYQVRIDPDPSPTVAFSPTKITVLARMAATQKPARPPGRPLPWRHAVRTTARLGVFWGRNRDGESGVKTLWGDIGSGSSSVGGTSCLQRPHNLFGTLPVAVRDGPFACHETGRPQSSRRAGTIQRAAPIDPDWSNVRMAQYADLWVRIRSKIGVSAASRHSGSATGSAWDGMGPV